MCCTNLFADSGMSLDGRYLLLTDHIPRHQTWAVSIALILLQFRFQNRHMKLYQSVAFWPDTHNFSRIWKI